MHTSINENTQQSNWDESVQKFEDLNLKKDLLRGVFGAGFVKPSKIQEKGILPILKRRDTIAQAQSGSGKTATFAIGTLQLIDPERAATQALILAPTRELADQIEEVFKILGKYLGIKVHLSVGGKDTREDRKVLQQGPHVVIGTPGRVFDNLRREFLNPSFLSILVLDEADEMLGKGFLEQVNEILQHVPSDTQLCLVSATMPPEVIKMTESIMNNPAKILVKNEDITLKGIKQFYISCSTDDIKYDNMIEVFSSMDIIQCMIYVNTREKAEALTEKMKESGFTVECIHGQMEMEDRMAIMSSFRDSNFRLLVSTDLLARGIDVQPVGLVINFDLPTRKENYIHRVGRSGRYGRRGIAINLITKLEANFMMDLEEHYSTEVQKLPEDLSEID